MFKIIEDLKRMITWSNGDAIVSGGCNCFTMNASVPAEGFNLISNSLIINLNDDSEVEINLNKINEIKKKPTGDGYIEFDFINNEGNEFIEICVEELGDDML